jgi:CIC family chloride channel protein
MITYDDLRTVVTDPDAFAAVVVAGDLARTHYEAVTPADSLATALRRLSVRGSHMIPVVDDGNANRLLGVIGRKEILSAYDRELLREQRG